VQTSWTELATGYAFVFLIFIGLPTIFFVVTFLPGLMRTTGEGIGEDRLESMKQRKPEPQARLGQIKRPRSGKPRSHKRILTFENTP